MRYYITILLLFCGISTFSQNCINQISGIVIDQHDGTALAGATIIIAGLERAAESDFDGKFNFDNLCDGSYTLQISHPFCHTKGFSISVKGNTSKKFRLEHHLEELNEVTLKGEAYKNQTKSSFENDLSNDELKDFSSGTLGDALNTLSGVSSLNTGNTVVKPMINGLHSSRVLIINNGARMEDQEWGSEHAPNIDINSVGHISVIKGAGALQYGGDAVGGLIVAESPKLQVKDSLYGTTIVTGATNGKGGTISSQLTKTHKNGWYGAMQATLKRFGDYHAPNYVLSNTGVFEGNGFVRVGLNKFNYGVEAYYSLFTSELGILSASHLGGAEDQIRAINSEIPLVINDFTYNIDAPKQNVVHHLARIKAFKYFDDFGKVNFQYDFQSNNRLEFDIRRGDDAGTASLDLRLKTHSLLLDFDGKINDDVSLKTGLMGRYQNNFANPETGVRRLIPDYDKYDLGVYTIIDYYINQSWLLEAGIRYDFSYLDAFKFYKSSLWESRNYDELYPEIVIEESGNQVLTNPQFTFNTISATAGATYNFEEHYKLFFNYSMASRAPNPSELFSEGLHHSAARIEIGDLNFKPEMSNKFSLVFERKSKNFNFSINAYYNFINDFMLIEPTEIQQTVRGNFQVWQYRQTNARLMGLDIDIAWHLFENLRFNHQFSLVKAKDVSLKMPIINMPPVNFKNEVNYIIPKLNNLQIGLQSDMVFRQNEFPNNNFEVFIPETETFETIDLSTPPSAYHLLNFKSKIDFKINSKSNLNVGFSITNVMNTSYRNYLNRLRYYADDLGRNFLFNIKFNY